jgi:nitrite reductase/ring-hydroxylating ferredoxin subunit
MGDGRITAVENVPEDSTFLFRVRPSDGDDGGDGDGEVKEAILVRLADGIAGWLNYCQHFTHIKLDKGSGAPVRDGEVICANHGAMFDADSGLCTFGPCEDAYLNELDVAVADGGVYLTDDAYAFAGTGPVDSDDDMSSSSNVVL